MKRILINATHNEEIRVALCKDSHLYDFDLENRTREQKKANIYKGHITRVEPSLEAVFVEYGSVRQGFLPLREIAPEYLKGDIRNDNIKQLIKEGDEVIVQVEKEERGNKGAALSTFISLAGRYLVLMPNNSKGGGISRQISGKVRDEMKQIIASLSVPHGMSVIVRTAGLGKGFEDLQNDLNHLLDIWASILEQNKKRPSPCLVHQEAGVVTRAMRDYLRDDIGEIWIDSEHAYNEAANFIAAVMPSQMSKLRKYTDYKPLFARFDIERQIETAYQREVRLPSGGSIVIDQTEAMVAIDINSAKSTKGSDVAQTAYHTNLEAADEIARQLRLRDMGGLIVIDFIDMNDPRHQKDVEKRLIDATRYDRARVQFAEISKFGLMEMSRQRLRPSLEEATGYICPRCHGNGMIRDLRSLALSIMRQIEHIALQERMGEIQAEVPTDIAAFLLNEKRESLVYLEQDSGTRITILPHAHLESPNFSLHFNPDGFAPSSYERIADTEEKETIDRGYDVNWQTKNEEPTPNSRWQKAPSSDKKKAPSKSEPVAAPTAVAWLSNLFAPKPQANLVSSLNNTDAAAAIESIVNAGGVSLGAFGSIVQPTSEQETPKAHNEEERKHKPKKPTAKREIKEESTEHKERNDKKGKKEDKNSYPRRETGSYREPRAEVVRAETLKPAQAKTDKKEHDKPQHHKTTKAEKTPPKPVDTDKVVLRVSPINKADVVSKAVCLSLDDSKINPNKDLTEQSADKSNKPVGKPTQTPVSNDSSTNTNEQAADKAVNTTNQAISNDDALVALAKQMNKAINDPRVVSAYHQKTPDLCSMSAGELIVAMLGADAGKHFVSNFLAAMAKYRAPQHFDFANYGYTPLSSEYLTAFYQCTNAKGQHHIAQGKTDVVMRPITQRASNDPRGQYPDFGSVIADDVLAADTPSNDAPINHDDNAKDDDVVNAQQPTQEPTSPPAPTDAQDGVATQDNDDGADDVVIDSPNDTSDENETHSKASDDTSANTDTDVAADNKKDKPTSSYKDMIENVSGQLLQPVGILSLVAPKKPKVNKPKVAKSVAKKTSKAAQKAQVVKRKASDDCGETDPSSNV